MILNLQLVRGLAAMGVVYYHTHFIFPGTSSTEFYGVAIFFVLSGFIISLVTQNNVDDYAIKRLLRVAPMYWTATLLFAFAVAFGLLNPLYVLPTWFDLASQGQLSGWFLNQAKSTFTFEYTIYIIESLSFLPMLRPQLLGVGWTLVHEVFFYAVFGCCISISRKHAPAIAAAAMLAIMLFRYLAGDFGGTIFSTYGNEVNIYFAEGIALFYIWRKSEDIFFSRTVAGIAVCLVSLSTVAISLSAEEITAAKFLAPPAVVATALVAERAGLRCRNRIFLLIGDASYSIYLTHLFIIEPLRTIGQQIPWLNQATSFPVMLLALLLSAILGIATHLLVEKPMLQFMHRRLLAKKAPGSVRSVEA